MRITQKQIDEGWKLVGGEWIAPDAKGIQVARYDANGKKVNIVETTRNGVKAQVEIVEDRTSLEEPLGPGWKRVEVSDRGAQAAAFIHSGLSRGEAELAAGIKKPESQNDRAGRELRDSLKRFTRRG